ncbi:hypothetical protein ACX94F_16275 [Stenotrophomonas hibiscicola]|uniref:Transmembrane protein n=1 Tax=Stenotrophomonas hibiscicola TaxID=86189 RepID=A0ABV0CDC4_9GAMM|nr:MULTISPECIES: hypothetical protein [Stenotrophomonas]EQM81436.1 membrane protein [Stenotrophomonas maltophilia MF89]MBA0266484.1 hypothetical protein [Stenotrophomonas maltophilia]MBA0329291.1 hypothetical protein [Stenotrophomonas maltophilia]MBA0470907.1 hypothetical protein [Stenotrophomonas maltophilia]MBA0478699.1 hypothetical protein [Stenotrophomonas maltophilia]
MSATANRAFVLSVLVLLLAATRVNHFAAIPDASWAVFFIGGFYLATWTRWAFPLLMVFAVLVDWIVIRSSGLDFWQHYCVSPGYWLLLPAYFSLWAGGMLLGRNYQGARWPVLAKGALLLVASVAICHLLAQGGFYWTSRNVAEPTLAGWAQNYAQWFGPYLRTTAIYVALAAALQLAVEQVLKLQQARRDIRH